MTTTDHTAAAMTLLDSMVASGITQLTVDQTIALATTHATLALVEQQRLTNMNDWLDRLPRTPPNNEIRAALRKEIAAHLGLDGGAK